jgi:pimeloyl-ACP methyl ester carboxylesterase
MRGTEVPDADEVAAGIASALGSIGLPPACIVAHSYGSLIASRLIRRFPECVASTAFIDPGGMGGADIQYGTELMSI